MITGQSILVINRYLINGNAGGRRLTLSIKPLPVDRIAIYFMFTRATMPIVINLTFSNEGAMEKPQNGEIILSDIDTMPYQYFYRLSRDRLFEKNNVFASNEVVFEFGYNEEITMEMGITILLVRK